MASADKIIAISDFIARHIRDNYGVGQDRLRVVNRGIDMSLYDPAQISEERKETLRQAWKIKKEDRVVLLPARLSPIKGHKTIIGAMAKMKRHDLILPLVLFVGDDQGRLAYTQELEGLIEDYDLQDRIRLVGACGDMAAAYALSDLVLAPSRVPEGFGRTPVEGMAMGVPVLASNLGAMVDTILEGQTGWLLPPDDAGAWASKMNAALALDPVARQKMAQTSRAHIAERYSLTTMIVQTLAVYDEK